MLQNAIHWIKSIAIDKRGQAQEVDVDSVGHYKPITSPRFLHDWLGLPCVGFDLDQYYLDIARRQLTAWVDEDLDAAQLPLGVAEDN